MLLSTLSLSCTCSGSDTTQALPSVVYRSVPSSEVSGRHLTLFHQLNVGMEVPVLWFSVLQDLLNDIKILVCSKDGIELLLGGSPLQALNPLPGMKDVES